MKCT